MSLFKAGDFICNKHTDKDNLFLFEVESVGSQYKFKYTDDTFSISSVENLFQWATEEQIRLFKEDRDQRYIKSRCENQAHIVCPYCFNEHDGFIDGKDSEFECSECDEYFTVKQTIEVSYSTKKNANV